MNYYKLYIKIIPTTISMIIMTSMIIDDNSNNNHDIMISTITIILNRTEEIFLAYVT